MNKVESSHSSAQPGEFKKRKESKERGRRKRYKGRERGRRGEKRRGEEEEEKEGEEEHGDRRGEIKASTIETKERLTNDREEQMTVQNAFFVCMLINYLFLFSAKFQQIGSNSFPLPHSTAGRVCLVKVRSPLSPCFSYLLYPLSPLSPSLLSLSLSSFSSLLLPVPSHVLCCLLLCPASPLSFSLSSFCSPSLVLSFSPLFISLLLSHAQVYDNDEEGEGRLKLNDVVEFIGVLSYTPHLTSFDNANTEGSCRQFSVSRSCLL